MRTESSPAAMAGYCSADGGPSSRTGGGPPASWRPRSTSNDYLAEREAGAVRASPELQIGRLGRQVGGEREGLAPANAGKIGRGEATRRMPGPGAVADHVEVGGDGADGCAVEPEMKVYRVGPGWQDDSWASHLAAAAWDEVECRAVTSDAEIPLDRARVPDLEKHGGKDAYDPLSVVAASADQRLELRLPFPPKSGFKKNQREPVVPDTVTFVREQLGNPPLSVLAVAEVGQVEQVEFRVVIVRNSEGGVQPAIEREVERENELVAVGEERRQVAGHRQRGLGPDDAMQALEVIAVRVPPEILWLDRSREGVDGGCRHERDGQRQAHGGSPPAGPESRAPATPEREPDAQSLNRAHHQPAQSRREILIANDELIGSSAQVRVGQRRQSDQEGAPTQQRKQPEGQHELQEGLELVEGKGADQRVDGMQHNGAQDRILRAPEMRIA